VGEYLYHPASSYKAPDGTSTVPSGLIPRNCSEEWTPIAGMSIATGFDRGKTGPTTVDEGEAG
jgi:hypothetical protein